MNIQGERVTLRAIEQEDLPLLNVWANDPAIQRMLGGWHFPTSMSDQARWLEKLSCSSTDQRFAVEAEGLGLIGTANLVSIDWKNRNAFHGIMLGSASALGKGYGVETIKTIMGYAFNELGLMRLDGDVIEYNRQSMKTYVEKCHWVVEGRRPKWYFRDGAYWDKILLGITNEQYQQTR